MQCTCFQYSTHSLAIHTLQSEKPDAGSISGFYCRELFTVVSIYQEIYNFLMGLTFLLSRYKQ